METIDGLHPASSSNFTVGEQHVCSIRTVLEKYFYRIKKVLEQYLNRISTIFGTVLKQYFIVSENRIIVNLPFTYPSNTVQVLFEDPEVIPK